mgnify:CR=1 FL=1
MTTTGQETAEQAMARMVAADPDRQLCVRFMPTPVQPQAYALLALRHELLRAIAPGRSGAVAGPMAAYVRLQWWREVLEGTRRPEHAIAPLLLDAVAHGGLARGTVLRLVTSAEAEVEGGADVLAWQAMLRDGAGALQRGMGELLGLDSQLPEQAEVLDQLEAVGMAYGAGSMLRHLPVLAGQGRYLYPGMEAELRQAGLAWLETARATPLPPRWRVAALPAVLARRDLARGVAQAGRARGLGDRLAVMLAGLRCAGQAARPA